jgi:hypothetical protein
MSMPEFQRSYEIAPIILVGGIVPSGGAMSILTLTEGREAVYPSSNQYFAHFKVSSGSTLESWGIAEYPFASMAMAANAIVQMPLNVSLIMECPAQNEGGYTNKTNVISQMKAQLDNHMLQGGTFTVATPAYTYTNCLLRSLRDVTSPSEKQVQKTYQWDFEQPLITQEAVTSTYNNLFNKFSNGLPIPPFDSLNNESAYLAPVTDKLTGAVTTFTNFNPSSNSNFQFPSVLDGIQCNTTCTFNQSGQRYFFNIADQFKNNLLSRPLTASPNNYNINLLANVFKKATMVYRASSGNIETTVFP